MVALLSTAELGVDLGPHRVAVVPPALEAVCAEYRNGRRQVGKDSVRFEFIITQMVEKISNECHAACGSHPGDSELLEETCADPVAIGPQPFPALDAHRRNCTRPEHRLRIMVASQPSVLKPVTTAVARAGMQACKKDVHWARDRVYDRVSVMSGVTVGEAESKA